MANDESKNLPVESDNIEDFFTRDRANDGVKLPLYKPGGGKSKHWLLIRGIDSDSWKRADYLARRERAVIEIEAKAIEDPDERAEFLFKKNEEQNLDILVALVAGWSFPQECNPENVRDFLKKAPQIASSINSFSARRNLFFENGSNSSPDSQDRK